MLSNEEAVQIVATAPSLATAARSLVESAVRVWRLKYPTSKVDDCTVVCLYLDPATDKETPTKTSEPINTEKIPTSPSIIPEIRSSVGSDDKNGKTDLKAPEYDVHQMGEMLDSMEVTETDHTEPKCHRTLGDSLLHADESEGWNALDGITRVNSLVNLPRFPDGTGRPEGPSTKNS